MTRATLTIRRLWWFFTDMETDIRFNWSCSHCDEQIVMEGRGFKYPHFYPHRNPVCKYRRYINYELPRLWWLCLPCWKIKIRLWSTWVIYRWGFRREYSWGYGVPPECIKGDHSWPDKPETQYEDHDGTQWLIAACQRCGVRKRWGYKEGVTR